MTTVEAARLCAYGEEKVVRIEDVSLPDPKTGELLGGQDQRSHYGKAAGY